MRIWLLIAICLFCLQASAQLQKLNQLRSERSKATAATEAACLNNLAEEFFSNILQSDSALKYAHLAYTAATRQNDKENQALSLIWQAQVQGHLLGNLDEMENAGKKALAALSGTNASALRSQAYRSLALAWIWKGQLAQADSVLAIAVGLSKRSNNKRELGACYQMIGLGFVKSGQLWKGFEALNQAQALAKETRDSVVVAMSLALIGRAFNYSGDPEKAIQYYTQSWQYKNSSFYLLYPHLEDLGYAYWKLNKHDSAVYFQQMYLHNLDSVTTDMAVRKRFDNWRLPDFSVDQHILQKNYDDVLARLLPTLQEQRTKKNLLQLMHSLLNLGRAYEGKKQWNAALPYGREVVWYARAAHNKYFLKEGHHFLSILFGELKKTDSAYAHFMAYTLVKDSMASDQFALRTALYAAQSEWDKRLALLNKEKASSDMLLANTEKELQLQSQLRNFLLGSLAVIIVFSILLFRNIMLKRRNDRLTSEQAHSSLKSKALELEMQALRAQMNPHFIFNCLSAIDNLVQTNQSDKATAYLSRFAKLIRAVLDSSRHNLVSFQRDFETLQLYLEMEKFRCNNKFSYNMLADERLLNGDYKVPPLIIQPFVENAIHHGLLSKVGNDRQLDVKVELVNEQIVYNVTDNGIGRKQAAILKAINKPQQQSYGIDITRERISLFNKNGDGDVAIYDLELAGLPIGTRAMVKINS